MWESSYDLNARSVFPIFGNHVAPVKFSNQPDDIKPETEIRLPGVFRTGYHRIEQPVFQVGG